ncbi:helix-turn-helix domain-containing protein, partial [Elusimicrobiota bacterium]
MKYLSKLGDIRREKGLTQRELAEKSGVSYDSIIKIERGGVPNPTIDTAVKLSKALGVD